MPDARKDGDGVNADGMKDYGSAFEMLRLALVDVVDGKSSCAELRTPVKQLCVFARSEDIKAEELLVRFKELWANLPPLAGLPRGRQRNDLMARIATMCIEEFYGPPPGRESLHDS